MQSNPNNITGYGNTEARPTRRWVRSGDRVSVILPTQDAEAVHNFGLVLADVLKTEDVDTYHSYFTEDHDSTGFIGTARYTQAAENVDEHLRNFEDHYGLERHSIAWDSAGPNVRHRTGVR